LAFGNESYFRDREGCTNVGKKEYQSIFLLILSEGDIPNCFLKTCLNLLASSYPTAPAISKQTFIWYFEEAV